MDTTGRLYDEFIRLLFFHAHREASVLVNELPEESDQFCFLRASCFLNLKGSVEKGSVIRVTIRMPEESDQFCFLRVSCFLNLKGSVEKGSVIRVTLPRFIRSSRPTSLLAPSLVLFPPRSGTQPTFVSRPYVVLLLRCGLGGYEHWWKVIEHFKRVRRNQKMSYYNGNLSGLNILFIMNR